MTENCILFVIRKTRGIVRVKRLCNNHKIPSRGTPEAAGVHLTPAQAIACLEHGKVLVITDLTLEMPLSIMVA